MSGAGYWEEFGGALDEPEEENLEKGWFHGEGVFPRECHQGIMKSRKLSRVI
jgi:hypothetical protein